MIEKKKFYWIKLKTDFFNQDTIDFLLSQKNGCEYVVLYQMLCLMTANNNGELATRMEEVIIPFNVDKIVRDTKYFDFDTVTVALELFKKLGLIYEEENQMLKITNLIEMIGSESASREAIKKRNYRLQQKKDNLVDIKGTNCPIEYRDKSIEYRDESIDNKHILDTTTTINIYKSIEKNFCRTLSPMEYEQINSWLLSFDNEMINYAIKISVMANKKNFKYVNGILKNWKSNGYKTLQEVKDNETKKELEQKPNIEIFEYDWLTDNKEEEDDD